MTFALVIACSLWRKW